MPADNIIRKAQSTDLDGAVGLLTDAGLPVDDLTADHLALVAEQDGALTGIIGIETLGAFALLRSLVVAGRSRGQGLGEVLVGALEEQARACSVRELWLLTIDADAFFARLGYDVRGRNEAPVAIQTTAEFSTLCPGDAVLMSKSLRS